MGKPSVLIVEDNPINALVLTKIIEDFCHVVHVVNDVQTLKAIESFSFSLILMDINLGGNSIDGEALMKIIKEDANYRDIPVFAVTSYALPEDRKRFLEAGFDNYFSKPIDKKLIIPAIREALSNHENLGGQVATA